MENKGKKIIIAERDNIAAVMKGKKIMEFFVHRGDVLLGDIYLAKVDNILPSIDAAFVDVGVDKMGFLHAEDVIGKGALREKLSPKQKIVVQVVKEPTGHKGPRVTTEVSLPGRFLVLIPNETGVNVSKKIESSKEKARLKALVSLLKPVGVGIIIRTEAEGQSEADIQEDLEILLEKWNNIVTSADTLTPPNLLYRDQDLLYRVIREACTEDISEIVVDTSFALNRVKHLLQNWHMNKNIKVTLYRGKDPLLIAMEIHKEIKASLQPKVNLPSGGYLYVQTTEALTVIDVNSGKFISSATQDETILKTNKEAIKEIARQLKLRNIGGMIIIDFIDMTSRIDKLAILEELELMLEPDKSKPQIGQLSDLGLVELTRHRQGQSLAELFAKKCPHCQGNGYIMEELHFCAPIIESETAQNQPQIQPKHRKPQSSFKKQFNRGQNNEQNQPQEEILPQENIIEPQIKEETPQKEEKRFNKNRNHRFNKNKKKDYRQPETTSTQEPASEHETHFQEVIKEVIQEVISPKPAKQKTKKPVEEKPVKSVKKRVPKKIQKQEVKHEQQIMA